MKKGTAGFTLVELIVVIAILGILAGIAIPVYSGYINKAKEAADITALDPVKTAVVFVKTEAAVAAGNNQPDLKYMEVTNSGITAGASSSNAADLSADELASVAKLCGQTSYSFTFTSGNTKAVWNGTTWTLSK